MCVTHRDEICACYIHTGNSLLFSSSRSRHLSPCTTWFPENFQDLFKVRSGGKGEKGRGSVRRRERGKKRSGEGNAVLHQLPLFLSCHTVRENMLSPRCFYLPLLLSLYLALHNFSPLIFGCWHTRSHSPSESLSLPQKAAVLSASSSSLPLHFLHCAGYAVCAIVSVPERVGE